MSHSPQSARYQIHNAAQEIRHCSNRQYFQTALNYFCLCRIDPQDLRTEYICSHAQYDRYSRGQQHAVQKHPVHTFLFSHTVILAGKAHARLCHCIYGRIQKSQDIICRRIACHCRGTEGVHRRLQQCIGEIDYRALNPGRYSHLKNPFQINPANHKSGEPELITSFGFIQAAQNQNTGYHLGSHRTDGHACNTQRNHNHQQQIQYHIGQPCGNKEYKGAFCIAHRSQDRRAVIVQHEKRHSHKINSHINCRQINYIRRRSHQRQSCSGHSHSHKRHDNAADQRQSNGRMYCF